MTLPGWRWRRGLGGPGPPLTPKSGGSRAGNGPSGRPDQTEYCKRCHHGALSTRLPVARKDQSAIRDSCTQPGVQPATTGNHESAGLAWPADWLTNRGRCLAKVLAGYAGPPPPPSAAERSIMKRVMLGILIVAALT